MKRFYIRENGELKGPFWGHCPENIADELEAYHLERAQDTWIHESNVCGQVIGRWDQQTYIREKAAELRREFVCSLQEYEESDEIRRSA